MIGSHRRFLTFPLRLHPSLRQQTNDLAKKEGISLNNLISLAVAEKIARMDQTSIEAKKPNQKDPP
jgi:predicted HicB family RNase H-like nuclease